MTATGRLATSVVALVACLAAPSASAQTVLLQCGNVLDPVTGVLSGPNRVLVTGTVVRAIAPDLRVPEDAEVVDLAAATCMPGMIDLHTHLFITGDRTVTQNFLERSSAEKTLLGLRKARQMLDQGFTTVRVPGDLEYHFANIALRDAFARGEFLGPRMLVAPRPISPTGGHADLNELATDTWQILGTVVEAGADNVREEVRRQLKGGADWIKVMASGGVMSQNDDPEVQAFTDEEFAAMAEETHRHRRRITAHAHGNAAIVAAARAGFDSVEHGTMIEQSGVDAMLASGTVLIPTAYVLDWIVDQGATGGITEDNYRKAVIVQERRDESLMMAYRAGVPIGFGTDQIFPHAESPREFQSLVRIGIEPLDAIRAATSVAAALLGLQDELGVLEPGRNADIIAVPGNPLDDISVLDEVSFVMKHGRIVVR